MDTGLAARARLLELLAERAWLVGDFVLASGQRSRVYLDARRVTFHPLGQALLGPLALRALRQRGWRPRAVGGLTLGADPVAVAIARASVAEGPLVEAFTVRKEPKAHGTGRRIEGGFAPGWPVVVVEDVLSTGGSARTAAEALREAGARVLGVLAVVDREMGGAEALAAAGLPVHALFRLGEIRAAAARLGKPEA